MNRFRHAYYEAARIMLTLSCHSEQLAKVFNIDELFANIIDDDVAPEHDKPSSASRRKHRPSGKQDQKSNWSNDSHSDVEM